MNIIKKVIIVVMGIVVIGVLATNINIITQPKTVEKSVTFELLDDDKLAYNVYDEINKYAIYDNKHATNLVSVSVNGNIIDISSLGYSDTYNTITMSDSDGNIFTIYSDNTYFDDGLSLSVGDIITITFEVEQQTPLVVKTLLALAPLILTAGVLMIIYKGVGNKE